MVDKTLNRVAKLRPWQFSLRFLLAVTTLVAVGAAFFGWRTRQLEPQRRAVARIVELGGSVEMERRGWGDAIAHGFAFDKVVKVELPGDRADNAFDGLRTFDSLKKITLGYEMVSFDGVALHYIMDGRHLDRDMREAELRHRRLLQEFPSVEV